jgi:3-phenylpropionate/trans-cinnamate dioxygenase ferredoxin component
MTEFVTVATTDEIPAGERIVIEIERKWVAVFNVDGIYYAILDICSHDDGPLAEGELHGCVIECPRHGATFDITTGKVLSAPALVDVPKYEVRVQGNEIQVAPLVREAK